MKITKKKEKLIKINVKTQHAIEAESQLTTYR